MKTQNEDETASGAPEAPQQYSNPVRELTIHDWPFGRNERASARFYIESDPRKGERACRVITDPLTGKVYKPHKLTFARKVLFVTGNDGRTYVAELTHSGFVDIMHGNMKYHKEGIFETDPRFPTMIAMFKKNGQ